jgi:Arc/MetJ-type ribon-helix-helix transcriptional regulator
MTVHLPEDLERFVRNEVACGHFASEDDAISEAVRLLWQRRQPIPSSSKPLTEEEFEQRLRDFGLLASAPPRTTGTPNRRAFKPITMAGGPLSETVIQERR